MQTEKQPYELLVRWDQDGNLSGAHVQWRYVTRDDAGAIVAEGTTAAEPIDIGNGKGFPLADILSKTESDALVAYQKERAKVVERDQLLVELDQVKAGRAK